MSQLDRRLRANRRNLAKVGDVSGQACIAASAGLETTRFARGS